MSTAVGAESQRAPEDPPLDSPTLVLLQATGRWQWLWGCEVTGSGRAGSMWLCDYTGPWVTADHGLAAGGGSTVTCGSTQDDQGPKADRCHGLSRKHTWGQAREDSSRSEGSGPAMCRGPHGSEEAAAEPGRRGATTIGFPGRQRAVGPVRPWPGHGPQDR